MSSYLPRRYSVKKHEAEGILLDRIEADNSKPDWETFWRDNA